MVDLNRMAFRVVQHATEGGDDEPETPAQQNGRNGGLKGGVARAKKLSPEDRSAIAQKAARARWQRQKP